MGVKQKGVGKIGVKINHGGKGKLGRINQGWPQGVG